MHENLQRVYTNIDSRFIFWNLLSIIVNTSVVDSDNAQFFLQSSKYVQTLLWTVDIM